MAEQLSTEQVLLLNNLMYMNNQDPFQDITHYEGKSIADIVNSMNYDDISDSQGYGSGITGREWKEMITAIKGDDSLMNMTVNTTHVDHAEGGGGGVSALFTNGNDEAVVVFQGTAKYEWKDNALGGTYTDAADRVSTPQQENALKWFESLDLEGYESVTVSGHSKGGNKAKYITLLNEGNQVDRCLSFDGQGFSDEFCEKYKGEISERQKLIQNHNVEDDYVNFLLNDVGESKFYKAFNIGKDGVIENHHPNTFFSFDKDGRACLVEGHRNPTIAAVDAFFNSYLRTLSPKEKAATLNLVGDLLQHSELGDGQLKNLQDLTKLLLEGDNPELTGKLIAYLSVYEQKNPAFGRQLKDFLNKYGMQDMAQYIDMMDTLLKDKNLEGYLDVADFVSGNLPPFVLSWISKWVKDNMGLNLSEDELRRVLSVVHTVNEERDHVVIKDGGDIKIAAAADVTVDPSAMKGTIEELARLASRMKVLESELSSIASANHSSYMLFVKPKLNKLRRQVGEEATRLDGIKNTTQKIMDAYENTEKKVTGFF